MSLRLIATAGLLAFAGCAAVAPPVVESQIAAARDRWPESSAEDLERGRHLYRVRCGSCHSLESPDARTPEAWDEVLRDMAERSKLSEADRENVFRYLWAASRPTPEQQP